MHENSALDPSACAIEHDDTAAADYAMTVAALNAQAATRARNRIQVPTGPVRAYWSAVACAPPAGSHGHGADAMSAAAPATPMSRSQLWIDGMVRCVFSMTTATTIQGRMVVRILTRVYPNRVRKGNWIAALTANNAHDTVARVRPPSCSPGQLYWRIWE